MNNRVGRENKNSFGSKMRIINYYNCENIDVLFTQYEYLKKNVSYIHFKSGKVKCVYDKTIYHVGFIGDGVYYPTIDGKHTKIYNTWKDMLKRVYDEEYKNKHNTYRDVTVCEDWHNFQNFAKWYEDNYYEVDNKRMCLDKDILIKGNKIYSPRTCIFVPYNINLLFVKRQNNRGKYPIGVNYHKIRNNFKSAIKKYNKNIYLGSFDNPCDAFNAYKQAKEEYIKEIANEYKDKIPKRLYDVMCNYEVEITD